MSYFIYFSLAALIAFIVTPAARKFAVRVGAVDVPDGFRKIHKEVTPYGGGLAMYFSFFLVCAIAKICTDSDFTAKFFGLFIVATFMLVLGFLDDIRPIDARFKLIAQVIAATVLYVYGYRITHITWLNGVIDFSFWSIPITIFWITGVMNTINFIDGLDGLAAGISAIASSTVFVISFVTGNTSSALVCAILAGACIGFIPRNFSRRTKAFMGDSGAYFIGLILSVLSIESGLKSATFLTFVAPILAIGIPIFDTAFAIVRRLFHGQSIMKPDRNHIHHRLVDMGLGQKRAVFAIYFINVVFGMSAVAFINGDWAYGLMFMIVALSMAVVPTIVTRAHHEGAVFGAIPPKSRRPRILAVFGTRPEVIKMAPLIAKLRENSGIETLVCVTGQHREQLDQMLRVFELTPEIDLNLMKPGQTLAEITERTVGRVDEVISTLEPDLVMVHGDPSASFAAALAAFYRQVPIAHVEAGLRSGNIYSPFPEEYNRRSTGLIADLHFAATEQNKAALVKEGVDASKIYVTGNTAIDAVFSVLDERYVFEDAELHKLDFDKRIIVMTAHRRENLGERMRAIFRAVRRIADEFDDVCFVYAVHMNPKIRETAGEILSEHDRIRLLKPLGYRDMCNLMARCYMVVTDSGGLQEEAPALGKPVVLMRTETERQEAIEAGTVVLAGVEEESVYREIKKLLSDEQAYKSMATAANPYGDGHTSERIAGIVADYFDSKKSSAL